MDEKRLPRRALVDRAIASLIEIERRMGRGSEVTAVIERLLEFGRQFDDIPCADCGLTYERHRPGGQCAEFRDPTAKLQFESADLRAFQTANAECLPCKGSGRVPMHHGFRDKECPRCGGRGWVKATGR